MQVSDYLKFIEGKNEAYNGAGFAPESINPALFPYQEEIVRWACEKGRAAIFADTGLGKTLMQVEWARQVHLHTGKPVLILAPLAVSAQTIREARKFGIEITQSKDGAVHPITVTNYEKIHLFDFAQFSGIVLDESSILKSFTGKTKQELVERSQVVPYRLACTATPSPNDHMELGNHSQFLGVMPSSEMLMRFFQNDTMSAGGYTLKGHARKPFWEWVSTWAAYISKPSDMGFSDDGFVLPELVEETLRIAREGVEDLSDLLPETINATTLHKIGRETVDARASAIAEAVTKEPNESWLIWVNTNYEADEIVSKVPGAVEVRGSDSPEEKESALLGFADGTVKILVTKPSIAGFGMNWQQCARMAFVGLSFSYEDYYQAVRRCYRFGQKRPVHVFVAMTDSEGAIFQTIQEKKARHEEMKTEMLTATIGERVKAKTAPYFGKRSGESWTIHHGDCVHVCGMLESNSIGYSVYSPPFSNLYIYSDSQFDMGNSANDAEFLKHYAFLAKDLLRATIPGRLTSVHCKDLPMYRGRDGAAGLRDFPGDIIRMYEAEGWVLHSRVTIWKDPVIEMQRTKNHGLLYKQLCKDSAASRQGMADYILTFRKWNADAEFPDAVTRNGERFFDYIGGNAPGTGSPTRTPEENQRKYSIDVWQRYASPVWFDIIQTNVLNCRSARSENDERHICPLQLDVIARCIELWSNPGDLVFSPFTGIGSEGYEAIKAGRKFVGSELKESYFKQACENLESIESVTQADLFSQAPGA